MRKLKFKLLDTKKNEIVNYLNCSIDINGEGVQSFDKDGVIEGTANNNYLVPLQYTEQNDVNGNEIYDGMTVHQVSALIGSPDIDFTGEVKFYDGSWWIDNGKEAVLLFDEACENTIVKNIKATQGKEIVKTEDSGGFMTIGENIKRVRKLKKLTQQELAMRIKRTDRSIMKYESNSVIPPMNVLEQIALTLDVSVIELLGEKGKPASLKNILQDYTTDELLKELYRRIILY